jgi:lysyl-tRNA synthetase, class II
MPYISTRSTTQEPEENTNISTSSVDTQREIRLGHLEDFKRRNIDAFPVASKRDFTLDFVKFWFDFVLKENLVEDIAKLYGWDTEEVSVAEIAGVIADIFYATAYDVDAEISDLEELTADGLTAEEAAEMVAEEKARVLLVAQYRELFPQLNSYPLDKRIILESQFLQEVEYEPYFAFSLKKAEVITIAGRLKTKRTSGKIAFGILEDESLPSGFQCIFKKDVLEPEDRVIPADHLSFTDFKKLIDEGDYLQISGTLEYSQTGEPSLFVESFTLLSKSLRPLPAPMEYTHLESRYLDRVADFKLNTKDAEGLSVRDVVRLKNKYWSIWREEMESEGFLSVENPIFEHIPGGAEAKPFKTFYNELNQEMFLRISLELPLKKLIAGGFERVYEIGRVFRNESSSPQHLQEFTFIEWYCAYTDYNWAAQLVKRVFQRVVVMVLGGMEQTDYYGGTINWGEWCSPELAEQNGWELEGGWPKIRYFDAVRYFSNGEIDTEGKSEAQLVEMCNQHGITDVKEQDGMGTLLDKLWKKARVNTTNPFFLILPPVELEPLAKRDTTNPFLTQRWQVVAGRAEHGKAFSELNDPVDQFGRFEKQQQARDNGNEEAQFMDPDYIKSMEYGMPPMSGFGISDRFLSSLLGKHIKECSTFPYIRREEEQKSLKAKKTMVAHAIILDTPDIPMWSKLNAAAHLSASFAARVGTDLIHINESESRDGEVIPMNIQHAILMKKTTERLDLLELKHSAEDIGLTVSVFTEEMRGSSNDEKVELEHSKKTATEIGYLGVLIFGKKGDVEKLTDQFDLFD